MRVKTKGVDTTNAICFNIRSGSHEAIRLLAFAEDRTVTEILNDMLDDYCKRNAKRIAKLAEAKEQMRRTMEEGER